MLPAPDCTFNRERERDPSNYISSSLMLSVDLTQVYGSELLSAFLPVLYENLITLKPEDPNLESGLKRDVMHLIDSLSVIQMYLKDAEERHQSWPVRLWLEQIKDVAYDANDLLDDLSTEAMRCQLITLKKVRNLETVSLLNPKRRIHRREFGHRVRIMNETLDSLEKRRHFLNLKVVSDIAPHPRSISINHSSFITGRDDDKQRVIRLLVSSDGVGDPRISVIPLLGMGGLGKTTLARLVYNDETVKNHFELRVWVHVSRDFSVNRIIEAIIGSTDGSFDSTQQMVTLLQMKLSGHKYLLVLDDVWNANPQEWMQLKDSFLCGSKGSKILVTTRSEDVAANLPGCAPLYCPYRLETLSDDACWAVFCKHAFVSNLYMESDSYGIRHEIIGKCKGLPLAAETMGIRLGRESDRSKWGAILQNPMWEFSGGDSDILKLIQVSYEQLDSNLKPCFAYCSIFPRGCVFDQEVLVKLWMAQSFIHPVGGERIEDTGDRYFSTLVESSLFQYSHFDSNKNVDKYTMHSVTHGFAQRVSGGECCILENGRQNSTLEKTRHASMLVNPIEQLGLRRQSLIRRKNIFEVIYECKGLYSLLAVGLSVSYGMEVPDNLGNQFRCLRTLDFSNSDLSVLPNSIGNLNHLRYLQLYNTRLTALPESIGCLYHLQILGLRNCYDLEELPTGIKNLRRMRHLDLHLDEDPVTLLHGNSSRHPRRGRLRSMPPKIGRLTDLQTLSRFVVSTEKNCRLTELKNLKNLHGEIHISNLQLVLHTADATDANLASKEHLQRLELGWSTDCGSRTSNLYAHTFEEEVFRRLEPHPNLKELKVAGYGGLMFPLWIGDSYFSSLITLTLSDCKRCETLPALGQLPLLKSLYIEGMDGVVFVNCTFCGTEGRSFPSLQKLCFRRMRRMQAWYGDNLCGISSLRELVIKDCVDLRQLTHNLPSLAKLEIEGSRSFTGLPRFPSLGSLELNASGDWIWSWPFLNSLFSLTISHLTTVTPPSGLNGGYGSISRLEISYCYQLMSLPDYWLPTSLTYLGIKHCPQLRVLPRGLGNLKALEDMKIEDCARLHSLPDRLPTTLQCLSITNCHELSRQCLAEDWGKIANISSVWIDKQQLVSTFKS